MPALIADADGARAGALRDALAALGHDVEQAATAAEALERAAASAPRLVLVARTLGTDDGLAVCRALAGGDRLVVLIGAPEELDAREALDAGAADAWAFGESTAGLGLRLELAEHYGRLRADRARHGGELDHLRQALDQAGVSERRFAFLADASPRLDASLDLASTLDSVTRLSVPFLGDVCIVHEVARGEVHRLAAAAVDPAIEGLVRALPPRYEAVTGDGDPLTRVITGGRPEILGAGDPSVLGPAAAGADALRAGSPMAAMLVPLKARGRTIGALALLSLNAERRYGEDDLALAEELGRRAALALDNARLYERQSDVASALQAGLLPGKLPDVGGVELAARFRPAGDGSIIGGDFYDVLSRDDGFDVVVGDVTGKGARAAALTALARHTIRTAARYEAQPSGVLRVLNDALVAERVAAGRYCTVAFARIRVLPDGGLDVCVAVGGHPLPIALRGDGRAELVGAPGSILGWVKDPNLHDVSVELAPGEALVLYTDGVSEARTPDGMLGDARLAAVLESVAGMPAGAIAARLERAALQGGTARDDVALVVVRGGDARLDAQEAA